MDLKAEKRALRATAQAARASAADPIGSVAARAAALLAAAVGEQPCVSGYLPIRDELDPGPAMALFAERGAALCLPVVVGRGLPLAFRRWTPGAPTVTGPFGVEIPADDLPAVPTLLIVPMLAFDRRGFRLGYGGGFYDRTLAALRAAGSVVAAGLAYAAQEVPVVPTDATDAPLDLIVTEREVIACG